MPFTTFGLNDVEYTTDSCANLIKGTTSLTRSSRTSQRFAWWSWLCCALRDQDAALPHSGREWLVMPWCTHLWETCTGTASQAKLSAGHTIE